jgi:hypothetical protein
MEMECKFTIKQYKMENLFLMSNEVVVKSITEIIILEKFKNAAKGEGDIPLCIGGGFQRLILGPLKKYAKLSLNESIEMKKFGLLKPIEDSRIKFELMGDTNHGSIDIKKFLPVLWSMLLLQKNGEENKDGLLTNGCSNIFHPKLENGVAVSARVHFRDGEWRLNGHDFDCGGRWYVSGAFFAIISHNVVL